MLGKCARGAGDSHLCGFRSRHGQRPHLPDILACELRWWGAVCGCTRTLSYRLAYCPNAARTSCQLFVKKVELSSRFFNYGRPAGPALVPQTKKGPDDERVRPRREQPQRTRRAAHRLLQVAALPSEP